jgi:polar amino acid transport system permease protein
MTFELWFTVAALYLALTISLSLLVSWLERRLPARGGEQG